jgi:hypothetical protein
VAEETEGGFTALKELTLEKEKERGVPSPSLDILAISRHVVRGVFGSSGEKPLGGFGG